MLLYKRVLLSYLDLKVIIFYCVVTIKCVVIITGSIFLNVLIINHTGFLSIVDWPKQNVLSHMTLRNIDRILFELTKSNREIIIC